MSRIKLLGVCLNLKVVLDLGKYILVNISSECGSKYHV